MSVVCEPSGLVLNLRALRPGDIHDVLESLRGSSGASASGSADVSATQRIQERMRRRRQQKQGHAGEDIDDMPSQGAKFYADYGGGTLVGEILNRLQQPPFVLDAGAYGGNLVPGRPVDFRKLLITDVESAVYRVREAAGVPLSIRPNCGACGRLSRESQDIYVSDVEHWACSDRGKHALAEGTPVDVEGREWIVSLVPPTLARQSAVDRILALPTYPVSLRLDTTLLASIGAVIPYCPADAADAADAGRPVGAGGSEDRGASAESGGPAPAAPAAKSPTALERQVREISLLTRGGSAENSVGGPGKVLTMPLEIIQWWRNMDDWALREDIMEEVSDLWGGVDSEFMWTCKVDPTVCSTEQRGMVPLDLSFFGLVSVGPRRRRRK